MIGPPKINRTSDSDEFFAIYEYPPNRKSCLIVVIIMFKFFTQKHLTSTHQAETAFAARGKAIEKTPTENGWGKPADEKRNDSGTPDGASMYSYETGLHVSTRMSFLKMMESRRDVVTSSHPRAHVRNHGRLNPGAYPTRLVPPDRRSRKRTWLTHASTQSHSAAQFVRTKSRSILPMSMVRSPLGEDIHPDQFSLYEYANQRWRLSRLPRRRPYNAGHNLLVVKQRGRPDALRDRKSVV